MRQAPGGAPEFTEDFPPPLPGLAVSVGKNRWFAPASGGLTSNVRFSLPNYGFPDGEGEGVTRDFGGVARVIGGRVGVGFVVGGRVGVAFSIGGRVGVGDGFGGRVGVGCGFWPQFADASRCDE